MKSQKEKVTEWLYNEYSHIYDKTGVSPDKRYNDEILYAVYEKINAAEIWFPFGELGKILYKRKADTKTDTIKQYNITTTSAKYSGRFFIFKKSRRNFMQLVISEKPSVGSSIAKVLGVRDRKDGYIEGGGYIVSWLSLIHI